MDLTQKIIPVFFVLIFLANYFNFVGFYFILRTLPCMEGRRLRRRTKIYFFVMNCLYLSVIIMSFFPTFWPVCTDEKAYPPVLNFASMLFIVNYIFHFVVNCNRQKALNRLTQPNSEDGELLAQSQAEPAECKLHLEWSSKSRSQEVR